MAEIQGKGPVPIGPREKEMYQQEYKHGADLFQRALEQYAKSDNPYQKEEFKQVMDKALRVLNETARELKQQKLLNQNDKISQDYLAYQDQLSAEAKDKLDQDLERAKKLT